MKAEDQKHFVPSEAVKFVHWERMGIRVVGVDNAESGTAKDPRNHARLMHSMFGRVLMHRQEPYVFRWKEPASWWQMVKRDVLFPILPMWLWARISRRWPLVEVERSRLLEVKVLYPHLKIQKHPGHVPGLITLTVEDYPVATAEIPGPE